MDGLVSIVLVIVSLGLLNVWLLRSSRSTSFRGNNASDLKSEFQAYGLPLWAFYVVGFLKVSIAFSLLIGFYFNFLIAPSAALLAVLMMGAVLAHILVSDPIHRFVPALIMLLFAIFLSFQADPNVVEVAKDLNFLQVTENLQVKASK